MSDVKQAVIARLSAACRSSDKIVIRIGGPGAAGKSTFAVELAEKLRQQQFDVSILAIDCYLRDRLERAALQPQISGYDPAAYRLAEAEHDLQQLVAGRPIQVCEYDKVTGTRGGPVIVRSAQVIIVEGSMALQPCFLHPSGTSLYLRSRPEFLFQNRRQRELQLGFSEDEITEKYRKLLPDFHKYIVTQEPFADHVVEVDRQYQFVSLTERYADQRARLTLEQRS